MNVLFHIDESSKWQMVLTNVKNMLNYAQTSDLKFLIEVLANGAAVTDLKKQVSQSSGMYSIMKDLAENDVAIVACRNALHAHKIDENELCPFVRIVPSGVVELVIKQHDGYSYIKP